MKKNKMFAGLLALAVLGTASLVSCGSPNNNDDVSDTVQSQVESESSVPVMDANSGVFDYAKPVPKASDWVKKAYFDDAVFIGDSVSTGISVYEYMQNATVYAGRGISPENIFTKQCISAGDQSITIMQAMENTQFKKVYILLGANAAEYMATDNFKNKYGEIIEKIKELQPDAKIYIQSVFPITQALSDQNAAKNSMLTNETINAYNVALQQLAEEKQVYFVNVHEALADANGVLPTEYSDDGVHIKASQYQLWFDYLRTHTVGEF